MIPMKKKIIIIIHQLMNHLQKNHQYLEREEKEMSIKFMQIETMAIRSIKS
jgi:hypothetical protein